MYKFVFAKRISQWNVLVINTVARKRRKKLPALSMSCGHYRLMFRNQQSFANEFFFTRHKFAIHDSYLNPLHAATKEWRKII